MPAPRTPPARKDASRTLAIVAVGVLIAIAIAGIVLAGRQEAAPDPSSTAQAASAPTGAPDELLFGAGSGQLPDGATQKIAAFVERARAAGKGITVRARFSMGQDRQRDAELARARLAAIHHAIEANGMSRRDIATETVETAATNLDPREIDRVQLLLR